jgi:hypothetical protein
MYSSQEPPLRGTFSPEAPSSIKPLNGPGSRIDDARQGGDIDLVVVTDRIDLRGLLRIRRCILDRIGWQRLDLTIRRRDQVDEPLAASARVEGVRL